MRAGPPQPDVRLDGFPLSQTQTQQLPQGAPMAGPGRQRGGLADVAACNPPTAASTGGWGWGPTGTGL